MNITTTKDNFTEGVRQAIIQQVPIAIETDRAEASLCSLAFQSQIQPNRHIWLDTDGEELHIDLEEWSNDIDWDNAVFHIETKSISDCINVIHAWFLGNSVEACIDLEGKQVGVGK